MMEFFQIAGGIALTIFGVRFLRKGLDRLFGGRLVAWISHLTEKRWKSFGAGTVVGALAPSSTALSLITLQMLHAGQLTAERMLAVMLGANVGMTVTVQFLAFHVQDYAGLFLLAGVLGFQFLNRESFRGVGQCLLSLGFIFLAMALISNGAASWSASPESREWLRLFEGHPFLIFLIVAGLTVCMQSSTASIGLAIALSSGGLFTPSLLIPWVLGANIGIGLTALIAGWLTLEGKRLATANLIAKLSIALPFLIFPNLGQNVFQLIPGSLARDIAMFHTGFNLLTGLVFVPLVGPLTAFVRWLIVPVPTRSGLPEVQSHLDPQALESPSLALANAHRETLQMADGVKLMLQYFWKGYSERDLELILRVESKDDQVDGYYRAIKDYLSRIREGLTEEESRWQFVLLTFSNELESVGDIIDKNLCDLLRKQTSEAIWLSNEDYSALCDLYERVLARFNIAQSLLAQRGGSQARSFLEGKESLNAWCREAQRQHYDRLRENPIISIASSSYFLDLLDNFRRINSHISAIGYEFASSPARRRNRTPSSRAMTASPAELPGMKA